MEHRARLGIHPHDQQSYLHIQWHPLMLRMPWDEPSLTLTCAPAQKQTERCHPEETRPLTVREYARIQVFPDNWKFAGSITSLIAYSILDARLETGNLSIMFNAYLF